MNLRDAYIASEIFARGPHITIECTAPAETVPVHLNSESYTRGFVVTDYHT